MKKEENAHFYKKLKEVRRSRGLTVNELAEIMGENHQKVGRVERGKSHLTVDYLLKISKALKTPVDAFLQETPAEEKKPTSEENFTLLNQIILLIEENLTALIPSRDKSKKAKLISNLYGQAQNFPQESQETFLKTQVENLLLIKKESPPDTAV